MVRSTLELFVIGMEFKLQQNDYKGGWEDMTPQQIITRIKEELVELEKTFANNPGKERDYDTCFESFDIANFCYFLWHNISKPYRVTSGLG